MPITEEGESEGSVNCDSPMKVLEGGKWELWKDDLPTSVKGGNGGSGRRSSQLQKGSTQRALLERVYIKLAGQDT